MKKIFYFLPMMMLLFSCSNKATYIADTSVVAGYSGQKASTDIIEEITPTLPTFAQKVPEGMIPKATAFKMSGDYADNVAITFDDNGELIYFPDPSDLGPGSLPVPLGNGWWLNKQGISYNSVFTKYTFAEYMNLPSVPSVEELKASVIPGAKVTEMILLPFNINEASQNIDAIKAYVADR